MSDQFASAEQPSKEFDRWGRRLLPDPEDTNKGVVPWTRATTLAGTISDMWNLHQWELRQVALGLGIREDLYMLAASLSNGYDPDDKAHKAKMQEVCKDALEAAKSREGANRGTALHGFTQTFDETGTVEVPSAFRNHLEVYNRGMAANAFRTRKDMIERIVVNTKCRSAGMFDRLLFPVTMPGIAQTKVLPVVGDLKTEKGEFEYSASRTAIQLGIYANADWLWNVTTRTYEPMPEVNREYAIVMHLPSHEEPIFQLYRVDIKAGWLAVQLCMAVREWRSRKGLMTRVGIPVTMHTPAEVIANGAAATMAIEGGRTQPAGPAGIIGTSGLATAYAAEAKPAALTGEIVTSGPKVLAASRQAQVLTDRLTWLKRAEAVSTTEEASALWRDATEANQWDAALEAVARRSLSNAEARRAATPPAVPESTPVPVAPAEAVSVGTYGPTDEERERDDVALVMERDAEVGPVDPAPASVTDGAPDAGDSASGAAGTVLADADWHARAHACRTRADGSALWVDAKAAGVWTPALKELAWAAIEAAEASR